MASFSGLQKNLKEQESVPRGACVIGHSEKPIVNITRLLKAPSEIVKCFLSALWLPSGSATATADKLLAGLN
ncbi:hypothetical protein CEXT_51761 [Caerostris extrusa]|uniref:Uncharacterized protein n=1 Tax=Caerostris extrusa TaxID=172846 RepID=A0AAV4UB45_CAEEX|nr:hypothetical protein CEXT_51761 [Caerostris extrusa]